MWDVGCGMWCAREGQRHGPVESVHLLQCVGFVFCVFIMRSVDERGVIGVFW